MSERETVVREPPFAATWLVRCVWRAYTLPAASSVATAAAHSGTPPEHLRRPSVNAARAAATLPRHASLWPSMSHIFHDSGYLRCAQENYYSHLLGVAKLTERCSDGVGDQGAEEALWGIEKRESTTPVLGRRAASRASGPRFSAPRSLPP